MGQFEVVRAFEGEWTVIEPPVVVGDPTKQYRAGVVPRDNEFNLRSALAVSQTAGRYFETVPGAQVITFLSHLVSIPKPGEVDVVSHRSALYRSLGALGIRLMKSGCEPMTLERQHPLSVYYAELESPTATFARATNLHGDKLAAHRSHPLGPGYATVRWDTLPMGITLGWCDPIDGRRSELFVDTARIRREYPTLEPVLKRFADPGGL